MSNLLRKNKQKILQSFLKICPLNGWNNKSLKEAIKEADLGEQNQGEIFSNINDLIDFFVAENNQKLVEKAKTIDLGSLRIRDKVKELVKLRLLIEEENKNALKVLLTVKQGRNIPYLMRNIYQISDAIWEIVGDREVNFSFYSKRFLLSKVFLRSLVSFIHDQSPYQKSWLVLDKEIAKVMKIGQLKAELKNFGGRLQEHALKACNLKEKFHKLPFVRLINPKRK